MMTSFKTKSISLCTLGLLGLFSASCSSVALEGKKGFDQELGTFAPVADQSSTETTSSKVETTSQTSSAPTSSSSTSEATQENPSPGCVEGALRECQESPSGEPIHFPGGVARGNCKKGYQRCKQGAWSACKDAVAPQAQDDCAAAGDDATCNGIPNEGCGCIDSQEPRPCGKSSVGACELGTQACVDGEWQSCEGETKAAQEQCDNAGIDEDCDGLADLQDPDCECRHEDQELCALPGKGDCSLGKRTCNQGQWGACQPRFEAAKQESCGAPREDELGPAIGDEDCDGEIDNNPANGLDPIDCQPYMIDADQDGYGAIGENFSSGAKDYTFGCFCPGRLPSKELVLAQPGKFNADCGDCEDTGNLVNPSIRSFHEEPSDCLMQLNWEHGAYDYNCDKQEEQKYTTVATCEKKDSETCEAKPGLWYLAVPKCGVLSRVGGECQSSTPPCQATIPFGVEQQVCR